MNFVLSSWHLLLLTLVGIAQRENERKIEILKTQLKICKQSCGKRILLSDAQRRILAVQAKTLSRRGLEEVMCLFSPDTILRWHRELVAQKRDYSKKRKSPGRPKVAKEIEELVLRMAKENPTWGYDRIQGALANLGHEISDATVGNILKAHCIEPAPERKRKTTWKTFIKSHWDVLSSIDFTTVEVWTKWGLATFYLLFVLELKTRRVHLAGITMNPDGPWMQQVARNLTAFDDGALNGKKYILMDRDSKFCEAFRSIIENEGTECVLLPPRSPNLNANIERFMRSIKDEVLSRIIFFGEASLRKAVNQYLEHYHAERNHQGLGNKLIEPGEKVGRIPAELNVVSGSEASCDTTIARRPDIFLAPSKTSREGRERFSSEPFHFTSVSLRAPTTAFHLSAARWAAETAR